MKMGDFIRISERKYHAQENLKVSEGKIILITKNGITILNKSGFNETFNIGDLISKRQRKELKINGIWEEIKFKQEGGRIYVYKVIKANIGCCNGNC